MTINSHDDVGRGAPDSDVTESDLTVLTWNLWWRFGDWERRAPAIAEAILGVNADVIALQEVWGEGDTNHAAELADELGYHVVFAPWHDVDGVGFGNAVLSRWGISEHEVLTYAESDGGHHRLALRAEVDGPRGVIEVISTHLNWRFDDSNRRCSQVVELLNFVSRGRRHQFPPVVCGDFNAEPTSDEIEMMTGRRRTSDLAMTMSDVWESLRPNQAGWTWCEDNPHVEDHMQPNRRIDYIFTGSPDSDGRGTPMSVRRLLPDENDPYPPSDHHGLIATLRY